MSCERPTVVERPYYGFPTLGQVLKQQWVVEIIAMNVVQMDNVRIHLLNMVYQFLCRSNRHESVIVENARCYPMDIFVCHVANVVEVGFALIVPSSVCDMALPAIFNDQSTDIFCDLSVRSPVGGDVYL